MSHGKKYFSSCERERDEGRRKSFLPSSLPLCTCIQERERERERERESTKIEGVGRESNQGEQGEDGRIFFHPLPLMSAHARARERGREKCGRKNFLPSSPPYAHKCMHTCKRDKEERKKKKK